MPDANTDRICGAARYERVQVFIGNINGAFEMWIRRLPLSNAIQYERCVPLFINNLLSI